MTAYFEVFADLSDIDLEESYVLRVDASVRQLRILLDLVLTPGHHEYIPPRPDQAFCYRRGTLVVDSDTAVHVRRSTGPPAVDATGETDHGHIDHLRPAAGLGGDMWELTGEWG